MSAAHAHAHDGEGRDRARAYRDTATDFSGAASLSICARRT